MCDGKKVHFPNAPISQVCLLATLSYLSDRQKIDGSHQTHHACWVTTITRPQWLFGPTQDLVQDADTEEHSHVCSATGFVYSVQPEGHRHSRLDISLMQTIDLVCFEHTSKVPTFGLFLYLCVYTKVMEATLAPLSHSHL